MDFNIREEIKCKFFKLKRLKADNSEIAQWNLRNNEKQCQKRQKQFKGNICVELSHWFLQTESRDQDACISMMQKQMDKKRQHKIKAIIL